MPVFDALPKSLPWCAKYTQNRTGAITNSDNFDQSNCVALHCRSMDFQVNLVGRKNLSGEIYRQIRNAIGDGRLRPGDCLPASRDLAQSLKVSRTTVTEAYDRLAGEGFVVSRIGAGTYVNNLARAPREEKKHRIDGSLQPRAVWDSIGISRAF